MSFRAWEKYTENYVEKERYHNELGEVYVETSTEEELDGFTDGTSSDESSSSSDENNQREEYKGEMGQIEELNEENESEDSEREHFWGKDKRTIEPLDPSSKRESPKGIKEPDEDEPEPELFDERGADNGQASDSIKTTLSKNPSSSIKTTFNKDSIEPRLISNKESIDPTKKEETKTKDSNDSNKPKIIVPEKTEIRRFSIAPGVQKIQAKDLAGRRASMMPMSGDKNAPLSPLVIPKTELSKAA
mmetsp:Transcript_23806/g.20739  ORF Transcript_23806/g.20739 Transcript_23806/m.20739 type:complete len:246 (-) Transcript_23806:439-1176(-)